MGFGLVEMYVVVGEGMPMFVWGVGGLVDWCNVVSWMEVMNAACMCGYCGVY